MWVYLDKLVERQYIALLRIHARGCRTMPLLLQDIKICELSSPLYKMVQYLQIIYAHPPKYFK